MFVWNRRPPKPPQSVDTQPWETAVKREQFGSRVLRDAMSPQERTSLSDTLEHLESTGIKFYSDGSRLRGADLMAHVEKQKVYMRSPLEMREKSGKTHHLSVLTELQAWRLLYCCGASPLALGMLFNLHRAGLSLSYRDLSLMEPFKDEQGKFKHRLEVVKGAAGEPFHERTLAVWDYFEGSHQSHGVVDKELADGITAVTARYMESHGSSANGFSRAGLYISLTKAPDKTRSVKADKSGNWVTFPATAEMFRHPRLMDERAREAERLYKEVLRPACGDPDGGVVKSFMEHAFSHPDPRAAAHDLAGAIAALRTCRVRFFSGSLIDNAKKLQQQLQKAGVRADEVAAFGRASMKADKEFTEMDLEKVLLVLPHLQKTTLPLFDVAERAGVQALAADCLAHSVKGGELLADLSLVEEAPPSDRLEMARLLATVKHDRWHRHNKDEARDEVRKLTRQVPLQEILTHYEDLQSRLKAVDKSACTTDIYLRLRAQPVPYSQALSEFTPRWDKLGDAFQGFDQKNSQQEDRPAVVYQMLSRIAEETKALLDRVVDTCATLLRAVPADERKAARVKESVTVTRSIVDVDLPGYPEFLGTCWPRGGWQADALHEAGVYFGRVHETVRPLFVDAAAVLPLVAEMCACGADREEVLGSLHALESTPPPDRLEGARLLLAIHRDRETRPQAEGKAGDDYLALVTGNDLAPLRERFERLQTLLKKEDEAADTSGMLARLHAASHELSLPFESVYENFVGHPDRYSAAESVALLRTFGLQPSEQDTELYDTMRDATKLRFPHADLPAVLVSLRDIARARGVPQAEILERFAGLIALNRDVDSALLMVRTPPDDLHSDTSVRHEEQHVVLGGVRVKRNR